MSAPTQLDIFGQESPVKGRRSRGLTEAQREIVRIARATGRVTSIQAGVATHVRMTTEPCASPPDGEPCCAACVKEGREVLRRLKGKNLLIRTTTDSYMPAPVVRP